VPAQRDPGVPRGAAALTINQPGHPAGDLITADDPVTEVQVETADG